jgi:serine/threonine protein kinase/tetratricopeptide (TPR) repeat protein
MNDANGCEPAKKTWQRVDDVVQRFEKAWQMGGRPAIDDFLPKDDPDRLAVLKELVQVDRERRLQAGESVQAEDYLQRFPELATDLTEIHEPHQREPVAPPQQIGRYRIEKTLGHGGFGVVYLAYDNQLQRLVAIKVPHRHLIAQATDAEAYLTEARTVANLDHPNIVPVHDVGSTKEFPCFIVSKFIEGTTLAQRIEANRPSAAEAVELVATVAEALQYAHKQGLVHRDIKPGNILLDKSGKPFVADFGLALREQDVGKGPRYAGTPAYMSPEQAHGEGHRVDGRSDIFSLGVVLYELLTGRRPFHADSREELLEQITNLEVRPPRQWDDRIPKKLERICLKALSKRFSKRYTTAKDMADDLRHFLAESTEEAKLALRSKIPAAVMLSAVPTEAPVLTSLAPLASNRQPRRSLPRLVGVIAAVVIAAVLLIGGIGVSVHFLTRGSNGPLPANPTEEPKLFDALAVLPFENIGADPEAEYLSDGIPESIIKSLYEVRSLKVRPFSSVARYKGRGKDLDLQEVGRQLKVQTVLTGKLTQRKGGLSLSVELVNVRDNSGIWIDQYERKQTDIQGMPEEIAKQVCGKLGLQLTGEEQKRLTKRYTDNPEAYQLYLKGLYFYGKYTEEGLKKGIGYFNQAIDKDRAFALAYAGLADSYTVLAIYGFMAPKEVMPKAKQSALKALDLDENLAEAHTAMAFISERYDWNWSDAEQRFTRAIALNPNNSRAHLLYAYYLGDRRRFDQSLAESQRAQALDPVSLNASKTVGWAFYFGRQYDQAIEQCKKTLEMDSRFWPAHDIMARAHFQKGMYDEAIEEFQKAHMLSPSTVDIIAELGYTHAVTGKKREAQTALEELKELSKRRHVPAFWFAFLSSGLGEKDRAFEWLEKAYAERSLVFAYLEAEPMFDGLRSDPRVADLLRRIGK